MYNKSNPINLCVAWMFMLCGPQIRPICIEIYMTKNEQQQKVKEGSNKNERRSQNCGAISNTLLLKLIFQNSLTHINFKIPLWIRVYVLYIMYVQHTNAHILNIIHLEMSSLILLLAFAFAYTNNNSHELFIHLISMCFLNTCVT